ncbi:hypothetical protein ES703_03199 [subsurface metagenome]
MLSWFLLMIRRSSSSSVSPFLVRMCSSRDLFSSATTSLLLALWLWSSRQKSSRFRAFSLLYTTSRAAIFSETKRTLFPWAMNSEIMLAMVWLFPVPGGPCITKLWPLRAYWMQSCWLLSASRTWNVDLGSTTVSRSASEGSPFFTMGGGATPARAEMTGCFAMSSAFSLRSWYMTSLWNEKRPIWTVRFTFQPRDSTAFWMTSRYW